MNFEVGICRIHHTVGWTVAQICRMNYFHSFWRMALKLHPYFDIYVLLIFNSLWNPPFIVKAKEVTRGFTGFQISAVILDKRIFDPSAKMPGVKLEPFVKSQGSKRLLPSPLEPHGITTWSMNKIYNHHMFCMQIILYLTNNTI